MPESEVAQLKQQIEAEYVAALRGLSGLSEGSARHQFMTQKTEKLWNQFQALVQEVGEAKARRIAFGEPLPENEVH